MQSGGIRIPLLTNAVMCRIRLAPQMAKVRLKYAQQSFRKEVSVKVHFCNSLFVLLFVQLIVGLLGR